MVRGFTPGCSALRHRISGYANVITQSRGLGLKELEHFVPMEENQEERTETQERKTTNEEGVR